MDPSWLSQASAGGAVGLEKKRFDNHRMKYIGRKSIIIIVQQPAVLFCSWLSLGASASRRDSKKIPLS